MKKRIIAILLAMLLAVSVMGGTAFAEADTLSLAPDTDKVASYEDLDTLGLSGTVVVYPKALETTDAKYPVIAWANGTGCITPLYYQLFEIWAEQGYVVVADANVMTADGESLIASIDYILSKNADPDSVFYGKIDADNIGASGHSQGGRAAVNACAKDSRIKCILSIAGASNAEEASGVTCPAFYMTGSADLIVFSPMWVQPSYEASKVPSVYACLKMAPHTTCIIVPDEIGYYGALWFDLFLKGQSDNLAIFVPGGQLSQDSDWQDVKCKAGEEIDAQKLPFNDVPLDYWAYGYIKELYDAGVVNGTTAETFEPAANLTRAQFVKMLALLDGADVSAYEGCKFADVSDDSIFAPYIAWAADKGIVLGYSDSEFAPNKNISRQQMAVIICRYAEYAGIELGESCGEIVFTDSADIADYAADAVMTLQKAGVINGYANGDGTFCYRPCGNITRAETCAILCRI